MALQSSRFRSEDSLGLAVAVALHAAVIAGILLYKPARDTILDAPERVAVSLATEVSLVSTAPDPVPESSAQTAPQVSENLIDRADVVREEEVSSPDRPETPPDRPSERLREEPREQPQERDGGASEVGQWNLDGEGGDADSDESGTPGDRPDARQTAAIDRRITSQLKPHWRAPTGADQEKLVTIVSFRLNRDGSLRGSPRVVRQTGITPANRSQAATHKERAIRAVQLAAPFNLPERFYSYWDEIVVDFDRKL